MAAPRKLPDVKTLLELTEQGMTSAQIGERYGTTRQAVVMALRGHREPKHNKRSWPWEIQPRHPDG